MTGFDGRIQTSNFEGRDGNRVFMTEVVVNNVQFLEPKSSQNQSGAFDSTKNEPKHSSASQTGYGDYGNPKMEVEDEFPF